MTFLTTKKCFRENLLAKQDNFQPFLAKQRTFFKETCPDLHISMLYIIFHSSHMRFKLFYNLNLRITTIFYELNFCLILSFLIIQVELKNPRCKICTSTQIVIKDSDQIFLDLPKLEAEVKLNEWFSSVSPGWSNNAAVIAKSWLKEGLRERCITRDLKWGTPVPLPKYKDKVS